MNPSTHLCNMNISASSCFLPCVTLASSSVGSFLLGIASNDVGTLFFILGWASIFGDVIFAFRYKSAYADIRRREQELEERERNLKEAEMRQAYQQQERGQRDHAGWQDEAKDFRKSQGAQSTKEKAGDTRSQKRYQSSDARGSERKQTRPPEDKRLRCLKILGLDPSRSYNPDELKAAYRREVKKTHPDAGGSQAEFIEAVNAYEWLKGLV